MVLASAVLAVMTELPVSSTAWNARSSTGSSFTYTVLFMGTTQCLHQTPTCTHQPLTIFSLALQAFQRRQQNTRHLGKRFASSHLESDFQMPMQTLFLPQGAC